MKWSTTHDELLMREILLFQPWEPKYASKERGQCWERISVSLNELKDVSFKVAQRSVQDRYQVLEKAFKKTRNEEEKASGINPVETDLYHAIA